MKRLVLLFLLASGPGEAMGVASSHGGSSFHHQLLVRSLDARSGPHGAELLEERELVPIFAFDGEYDFLSPADGEPNIEARAALSQTVYGAYPDDYDFLVVFTSFDFDLPPEAEAFAWVVRNDTQGIGLPLFDSANSLGSAGRLQGYVDMGPLSRWETDPLDPGYDRTLGVLVHEIMHRWAAYVGFRRPDGSVGEELLGRDGSHWSFLAHTQASLLYGNQWRDSGSGTFTSTSVLKFLSPLDLYLAGLYRAEEVPPFFLIDGPGIDPDLLPELGAEVAGERQTITIEDILAVEGPRVPSFEDSQKHFRVAMVLLTRPDEVVPDRMVAGINRLRQGLSDRFSILTAGRGLLEPYPQVVPEGNPGGPAPVAGGGPRPGAASLEEGLAWLRARQEQDGYWEDHPGTRVRDTVTAFSTLARLDPLFGGTSTAVAWLDAVQAVDTDSISRVVALFDDSGSSSNGARLSGLLSHQGPDGGWGAGVGFESDPLDTALALLALRGVNQAAAVTARERAISYLLARQNSDGGWGNVVGGASRLATTALALGALAGELSMEEAISAAGIWFATKQNADGGFGDSPSTAQDTARVLAALMGVEGLPFIDSAAATEYLASRQDADGSWEGSVYATASAVSALSRFQFPNWALTAPPITEPERPRDGERVRITMTVRNDGNVAAPAGTLRLFEGDPEGGGVPAAPDVTLLPLLPGRSVSVTLFWDSMDKAGSNLLVAVIDPEGEVEETTKLDNRLAFEIEVTAAPELAELEIREADIAILPGHPASLPSELAISVAVRNLGSMDAEGVIVRLLLGGPEEGIFLDEMTVDILERSSVAVHFPHLLTEPGTTTFTVVVDPEDLVPEDDVTNNVASRSVSTQPALDLEVIDADLELLGTPYMGTDVEFRIRLRNRGTIDSPDTPVRFTVVGEEEVRELTGATVQIAAGQEIEWHVLWRVDLTGSLGFLVEIDPAGVIPETDKSNNTASLPFVAGAVDVPNLAVSHLDIGFDPDPAREGQELRISALVRNTGGQAVEAVEVSFFDGEPGQGAPTIGPLQVIPELAASAAVEVEALWPRVPDASSRVVYVVVDPEGKIEELTEEDNAAFRVLEVLSLPDAAVSEAGLRLEPRFPAPGQEVSLTVHVANLGEQEIRNLLVRVYEGEPGEGGTPVGGDGEIPLLEGLSSREVSFLWTFGPSGARTLVVVVDPEGVVEERSKANNVARLPVEVQEESFFVTNRYFSPNGDSIQDTTELFFRLESPATVAIEIVDRRSREVVRRHAGPELTDALAGSFEWDGRDQRGRIARDGDYVLRVVDVSGRELGEVLATLDTNRSPLLRSAGTGFELERNLTCEFPTIWRIFDDHTLLPTLDEETFFFHLHFNQTDGVFTPGIYRMSREGAEVHLVVRDEVGIQNFIISPDGSWIAMSGSWAVWVARGDGSELRLIAEALWPELIAFRDSSTLIAELDEEIVVFSLDDGKPPVHLATGADGFGASVSPDGRLLAFTESRRPWESHLLDLNTGAQKSLVPTWSEFSWSPDGRYLAAAQPGSDWIRVFDRQGSLVADFELPMNSSDPYFSGDPLRDSRADGVVIKTTVDGSYGRPEWSPSSRELALKLEHSTWPSPACTAPGSLARFDIQSRRITPVAWTGEPGWCGTFVISTWDGNAWVDRGELSFGLKYYEKSVDLSSHLPDADGEHKVRIRQSGLEAAHVEAVSLRARGRRFPPSQALHLGSGEDVTRALRLPNGFVVDLHEQVMEVQWEDIPPARRLLLGLAAREEDLSARRPVPFRYPPEPGHYYTILVESGSPMKVDGRQTADDRLGDPLFEVLSRPDTGHPAAVVVGHVQSDGENLYAALDFTVDNTEDRGADWAALVVQTSQGWKELRVSAEETERGVVAFTHTGRVPWPHQYYEFVVPLNELGIEVGDTVDLYFEAYGTAALLEDSGDGDLLPVYGSVLGWDPNDEALLYGPRWFGEAHAVLMEGESTRSVPLFDEWNWTMNPRFWPSGRRIVFNSSGHVENFGHACHDFDWDWIGFDSLQNLTADLRVRRSPDSSGVILEGTAADLHFASYLLEYAAAGESPTWRPIAPPSSHPVVDGVFTTWVPSASGDYVVRLTVEDLAGNRLQRVRRVSFFGSPSITDLHLTPRYISPNGDGIQDEALLHYRVLAPVHLEVRVFNQAGERVRTFQRSHSVIGAEHVLAWNGRDDRGILLPDGDYRFAVQDYELWVTVDNTPPQLDLATALRSCRNQASRPELAVDPRLTFSVRDKHLEAHQVEAGVGADPSRWLEISKGDDCEQRTDFVSCVSFLDLEDYVEHRHRLRAQDKAGNRSMLSTSLAPEEVVLTGFGRHRLDPKSGGWSELEPFPCVGGGSFELEHGEVRLRGVETVRREIGYLAVQLQPLPVEEGAWVEIPVGAFLLPGGGTSSEPPDGHFELLWDLAGVQPGVWTAVRLRALDQDNGEHFSPHFAIRTEGVEFRGILRREDLSVPPGGALTRLLAETGLDPDRDLVLWGTETVTGEPEAISLLLTSTEDPRFATARSRPAIAREEGVFLFDGRDLDACTRYEGYVELRAQPRVDPVTGRLVSHVAHSRLVPFRVPCLGIGISFGPLEVGECDGARLSAERKVLVTPRSLDGTQLQLLTLGIGDGDGIEEIFASFNRPEAGREIEVVLDTTDFPEGEHDLVARLSNLADEAHRSERKVVADHTPPEIALTYPAPGQRVCGVPRDGGNMLEIEGRITDTGGFAYRLEVGEGSEPSSWARIAGKLEIEGGPANRVRAPAWPFEETGSLTGILGELADTAGEVTVRLRVVDSGGFYRCEQTTFFFDGLVEGAGVAAERELFSLLSTPPHDRVALAYGADEPTTVSIDVRPAVWDFPLALWGHDESVRDCVATDPAVRRLVDGQQLIDTGSAPWDGRTDGGLLASDGVYRIEALFTDGCGNQALRHACVALDTSPPALEMLYPEPGDSLPLIVEVRGSVSDPNLAQWSLGYGVGADSETWFPIAYGTRSRSGAVLGSWNTLGLSGDYTLRLWARDAAGNEAEVRVGPFLVSRPQSLISSLEAAPRLFSPNDDGRRETTTIRFGVDEEVSADLRILSSEGGHVRTLAQGLTVPPGSAARVWDGSADDGSPAPDGEYRVRLAVRWAPDPDVSQEEEITVVLDRTPPLIEISHPEDEGFTSSAGAIVGTVEDLHLEAYAVFLTDDPEAPTWIEVDRGEESRSDYTFALLRGLEEGEHALRIEALDEAEIHSALEIRFTIDDTPPVVVLAEPQAGSVLGAPRAPVELLGSVEEENLTEWRLELGAGTEPDEWLPLVSGDELPLPQPLLAWDPSGLADGAYTLRLVALDKAGHEGEARAGVVVDNTPPEVEILVPEHGGYVTAPGAIVGTAADPTLVELKVAVAPGRIGDSVAFSEIGRGTQSVHSNLLATWSSLPPDGRYTLRLRAVDGAGNQAETFAEVVVDTQPPAPPQGLIAQALENGDVQLTWQPNAEEDLAGYHVQRDGLRLTSELVTATEYLDPELPEGVFIYTVTAVDQAGLESAPSAPAEARLDFDPPEARIHRPADRARVSGQVDITGTAFSADDFKEYRVRVRPVDAAGDGTLLVRSPVPRRAALLAQWSTFGLSDEADYVVLLEAEDLSGNVARHEITVTVDNEPPAAPTGLTAEAAGADVTLTWDANAEADLHGYLLYRDGRLVNATGPVVGELGPYVIRETTFLDRNLPDGTFVYVVYAVDLAGNLSDPSAPAEVTLDNREPRARIVEPEEGAVFESILFVKAVSEDRDIASLRFEQRLASGGDWTLIGAALAAPPWEVDWDPGGLPYGDYRLRAVATDAGGKTDPAPEAITVTFTDLTPPAPIEGFALRVDGGDVHLSWEPNQEEDLAGYFVERREAFGTPVRIISAPIVDSSYIDAGRADGTYFYSVLAVDEHGNESEPSVELEAVVYAPGIDQPYTPVVVESASLTGRAASGAEVVLEVRSDEGESVELSVPAGPDGAFLFEQVPLAPGANHLAVRATDAEGDRSKEAAVRVVRGARPAAPTGVTAGVLSESEVEVTWGVVAEPELLGYRGLRGELPVPGPERVEDFSAASASSQSINAAPGNAIDDNPQTFWAPAWADEYTGEWLAASWPMPRLMRAVEVTWWPNSDRPSELGLEAWDGVAWIPLAIVPVLGEETTVFELDPRYLTDRVRIVMGPSFLRPMVTELRIWTLPVVAEERLVDVPPDGVHRYRVLAITSLGIESEPSEAAEVEHGDVVPPEPVTLSAVVVGSDVELSWTASTSDDVAHYDLYRDGVRIHRHTHLEGLTHIDRGLANGSYRYVVHAVDHVGNVSAPSNEVEVAIDVPPLPAPEDLTVHAPSRGRALEVTWVPGPGSEPAGYHVYRSQSTGGPYDRVAAALADTSFVDLGLLDGATYYYVIAALDAAGNESALSAEASGTPRDLEPPEPPILHFPGHSSRPLLTGRESTPVVGSAEPDSQVVLYRGGVRVGADRAAATDERTDIPLPAPGWLDSAETRLSPDGRFLWLGDPEVGRLYELATDTWVEVAGASGIARWFPDSRRLALAQGSALAVFDLTVGAISQSASLGSLVVAVPDPGATTLAVLGVREGQSGLWVVSADLERWDLRVAVATWFIQRASITWSPDGRAVAYLRTSPEMRWEIVELEDSGVETIPVAAAGGEPSWAPDGRSLVVPGWNGGTVQVFRYELGTGDLTQLTDELGGAGAPQWAPDGASVIYRSGEQVARIDPAGGEPEPWLSEVPAGALLRWSHRGHLLLATWNEAMRVVPAGRFAVSSVALEPGENVFVATAEDDAGNRSLESLPMLVAVDTGTRPDLVVDERSFALFPATPLAGEPLQVSVAVRNEGPAPSPPADLSIVLIDSDGISTVLAEGQILGPIPPGGEETVSRQHVPSQHGRHRLVAAADPAGRIAEVSEENNRAEITFVVASTQEPVVMVTTDRQSYGPGDQVEVVAEVVNAAGPFDGRLRLAIEDDEGFPVETLREAPVAGLEYGESVEVTGSWGSAGYLAGGYQAVAVLEGADGVAVSSDAALFALEAERDLEVRVATDRSSYARGAVVAVTGTVHHLAGNSLVAGAEGRFELIGPDGEEIASWSHPLGDLLPGQEGSATVAWSSEGGEVGRYRARFEVEGDGIARAAETLFDLLLEETGLEGWLTLSSQSPAIGLPLEVTYRLRNPGPVDLLAVPIRISVLRGGGGAVAAEIERMADLPAGGEGTGAVELATEPLGLGELLAVLTAVPPVEEGEPTSVTLDVVAFTTVDRTPPDVSVVRPGEGEILGGDPEIVVRAFDAWSTVDRVEALSAAGGWVVLPVVDAAEGLYGLIFEGLEEGPAEIQARATDGAGNRSTTPWRSFVIDRTPPRIAVSGVEEGGVYDGPVVPVIEIEEEHPKEEQVTLDGSPFVSGTPVEAPGSYLLRVEAEDQAGNRATLEVAFLIQAEGEALIVAPKSALPLDATVRGGQVLPGGRIRYQIEVSNLGDGVATEVVLVDPIPRFTELEPGSITTTKGEVMTEDPIEVGIGELLPEAAAEISFVLRVLEDLPLEATEVSNQGQVLAGGLPVVLTHDPATPAPDDPTVTPLAVLPGLSVHDTAVEEGDEGVTDAVFPVTLSRPVGWPVEVAYATRDETARAGEDYEETAGALIIAAGEAGGEIAVGVYGNELLQPHRTFLLELAEPVDAVLERAWAVGTILDDESCASPNLLINPDAGADQLTEAIPGWEVVEGRGWHVRSGDPEPIRGEGCFAPGAAAEAELAQHVSLAAFAEEIAGGELRLRFEGHVWTGEDDVADSGRLVVELRDEDNEVVLAAFDTGEIEGQGAWTLVEEILEVPQGAGWARVRLLATADPRREEGEELAVCFDAFALQSLRAAALVAQDSVMPQGDHGTADMEFPVRLICPVGWEVRARYETADGTAIADRDYLPAFGELDFAVGETETTVTVSIIGNTIDEPHKHFFLRIREVEGAAPLRPEAVGIILNDDWCPRSPGYWRNHRQEWPVDRLEIGGVLYDEDGIMAFLTYGGPDGSTRLARHLTAAELNVRRGTKLWILPLLEEAHEFLEEHPPGSNPRGTERQEADRLKDAIEEFNHTPCP